MRASELLSMADASLESPESSESLTWTSQPFRRQRGRGLAALGVILIIAGALSAGTSSLFWGVFAAFLLLLSLEGFFLPTRYELGEAGVKVQRTFSRSQRPWNGFRRVYEDRHGLTLSPYRRRTLLEPYRALRLLYDGGGPEQIRRQVRRWAVTGVEWIGPHGEKSEIDGTGRTGGTLTAGGGKDGSLG